MNGIEIRKLRKVQENIRAAKLGPKDGLDAADRGPAV